MKFSVLASGSKANSLLISSGDTRILVDCGLSARETTRRLGLLSVDPASLSGIVISHEHEDHVAGVKVLATNYQIPVFCSQPTMLSSKHLRDISIHQIYFFDPGSPFTLGCLKIHPVQVSHDAVNAVAFRISDAMSSMCIFSDLGEYTDDLVDFALDSDALIIETNHEEESLWKSSYPWEVKHRIAGPLGHLSNNHASAFIHKLSRKDHDIGNRGLKIIGAAHVSEVSNTADLALQAIVSGWGVKRINPHFFVGSAKETSELYKI
ncbi:MAG TPA: MBL fold metallo-hydrolase [Oligoflexia bacterium]|nr:MBL fold metallo-hydrolase [Oligoflexia bacterium]HMP47897.1 MBL fold metallo-hydrolase [Oligoflexia bacterium]